MGVDRWHLPSLLDRDLHHINREEIENDAQTPKGEAREKGEGGLFLVVYVYNRQGGGSISTDKGRDPYIFCFLSVSRD